MQKVGNRRTVQTSKWAHRSRLNRGSINLEGNKNKLAREKCNQRARELKGE